VLFLMLFFVLYMLPVLPVARRVEYVRTLPQRRYVGATRVVTESSSSDMVRVAGRLVYKSHLCNNCGGDSDFHKGGPHRILNQHYPNNPGYHACDRYVSWISMPNGQRNTAWGGEWRMIEQSPKIASSIGIAMALWLPLVIREAAKAAAIRMAPYAPAFAVEYRGPETPDQIVARKKREREALDADIERLEAETNKPIKELM